MKRTYRVLVRLLLVLLCVALFLEISTNIPPILKAHAATPYTVVVCSVIGSSFNMTPANSLQVAPYSGTGCSPYPNDTSFYYVWTNPSTQITAWWKGPTGANGRLVSQCHINVNIPLYWAGAHYTYYSVHEGQSPVGRILFTRMIDQYSTSGWQDLGVYHTNYNNPGFLVTMQDQEAEGQPAAADAVKFDCDLVDVRF